MAAIGPPHGRVPMGPHRPTAVTVDADLVDVVEEFITPGLLDPSGVPWTSSGTNTIRCIIISLGAVGIRKVDDLLSWSKTAIRNVTMLCPDTAPGTLMTLRMDEPMADLIIDLLQGMGRHQVVRGMGHWTQ